MIYLNYGIVLDLKSLYKFVFVNKPAGPLPIGRTVLILDQFM